MLLLIICILVSIGCFVISGLWSMEDGVKYITSGFTLVIGFFTGVASLVMIVMAIYSNTTPQADLQAKLQEFNSLRYQMENDIYDNDNDCGKKELYSEVTDWNEMVVRGKLLQNDKWVGVFYPDIYDHLEYIDLEPARK